MGKQTIALRLGSPWTASKARKKRMAGSDIAWAVALDGGTTNTRARLVDVAAGRVVATARRAVGVRDTVLAPGGGPAPLAGAVRAALEDVIAAGGGGRPDLVVAAGMLSSEVGLAVVPHVVAPAGLDALAAAAVVQHLPAVAAEPIVFVPGVRTPAGAGPDGWADADIMRGEECETLGACIDLAISGQDATGRSWSKNAVTHAFLWPGSHTKLVEVDAAGRIVRSHTTLAGELLQALARHTLLAASLPAEFSEAPDPDALEAGVRLVEREGLGRAAFLVRVAALAGVLDPPARAAFWVGAVVADDVTHLARHPILARHPPVWVGGREPLRSLYSRLLARRHPAPIEALNEATAERASAMGAVAVAQRHAARQGDEPPVTG
jgi:2-dehydro-3-deoxygalactonokinase